MNYGKFSAAMACLTLSVACGGGGGMGTGGSITVSLATNSTSVFQGQASVTVGVMVVRTGSTGDVTLTVSGLPSGASDTVQSPGTGSDGTVTLNAGTAATPGTYPVTVLASDGTVSASQVLSLTVGVAAVISNTPTGPFNLAMSTSFQPAEWDSQFFTTVASGTTTLDNLGSHHIRLQGISEGIPQGLQGTNATTWDFSNLDAITQPVLSVGDHSPEFQIAKAPAYMYTNNDEGGTFLDLTFAQFAGYAQNLVRYYNKGGFTSNSTHYVSPAYANGETVTWWGIYNEPNINNSLTPQQYTDMYNAVVPAMQTIDPTIKFAALELADFYQQPQNWLPTFVDNTNGVKAHVDVMATHFYSTCNQKDSDATVFGTIPGFVSDVQFFYTEMGTNPSLANVPVWVTENNVNADYDAGNGISACNGTTFVDDLRGSSPYFAAWRPYVFSQLGKAGVQALYHWDFDADPQFGEVDYGTGALKLSYWVDYWLGRTFPPTSGAKLLQYSATDDSELETLPILNTDGSVVVMLANRAVNSPNDNNGPGAARSILVDVSALGTFSSGTLLEIDKNTNVATGPVSAALTPEAQIPITLNGYSVAFLTLQP